jgi:hypothetical protein
MGLELNYNGQANCYLKAVPTTITEYFIDDVKYFNTYTIYTIYIHKGGEIIMRDGLEINFNPNLSVFTQIYNRLKEIYPQAIDSDIDFQYF